MTVAVELFNLFHMDPIKDAAMSNQHFMAILFLNVVIFGLGVKRSLALWHQIWANTDGLGSHDTMSVAV
jgi:hypothetical protein